MTLVVIILTNNFTEICLLIFWSHGIDSVYKGIITPVFLARLLIGAFLSIRATGVSSASL